MLEQQQLCFHSITPPWLLQFASEFRTKRDISKVTSRPPPLMYVPLIYTSHSHAIVSLWPAVSCWCWYCLFIGGEPYGADRTVPYLAIEEDTPVIIAWRCLYTKGSREREGANSWTAERDRSICVRPLLPCETVFPFFFFWKASNKHLLTTEDLISANIYHIGCLLVQQFIVSAVLKNV